MGKLRVYCLKTLNKLSIYPLGNTPSAPSVGHRMPPNGEESVSLASSGPNPGVLEKTGETCAETRASGSQDASKCGGTHVPSEQWSKSKCTRGKGRGAKTHERTQVEQGRQKGAREKAIACRVNSVCNEGPTERGSERESHCTLSGLSVQ